MTIYVHLMTVCVGVCLPREHIRFRAQLAVWACEAKRKWVGSTTLSTTTFPVHAKDEIFFFFFQLANCNTNTKGKQESRKESSSLPRCLSLVLIRLRSLFLRGRLEWKINYYQTVGLR